MSQVLQAGFPFRCSFEPTHQQTTKKANEPSIRPTSLAEQLLEFIELLLRPYELDSTAALRPRCFPHDRMRNQRTQKIGSIMLAGLPSEPTSQHKLLRFAPFPTHSPSHDGLHRFHHPPSSARVLLRQLLQHGSPRLVRQFALKRPSRREHIDQAHSHLPSALPHSALFLLPKAANVVDRLALLQKRRVGAEQRRVERSTARWRGEFESFVV